MLNWLLIYAAVIGTILVFDVFWLGLIARKFYANQLGTLMTKKVKALPALAFYLLFAVGLVILAVRPNDAVNYYFSSMGHPSHCLHLHGSTALFLSRSRLARA